MGFIQKKDEDKDYLDGIEVIGRGEGPDGDEVFEVELHEGQTAEDISGTTAERAGDLELEADPELLEELEDAADADQDLDSDADVDEAEDEAHKDEAREDDAPVTRFKGNRHAVMFAAIGIIAMIVAAIAGYVIGSGGFGSKGAPAAMLSEGELDSVVATWTYKGASHDLTAREAIEAQYSLEAVETEDGLYAVPDATSIVGMVRNRVLVDEAKAQGVEVDDDELTAMSESTLGTSDFEQIAKQYGVSVDQAKDILREQAVIQKLYSTVVKDAPVPPNAPEEPENGDTSAATPEYAEYIIGLAGDEWDAEARAWKDANGAFAQALSGDEFTGEAASYTQAQSAYFVAYQEYAAKSSGSTEEWTAHVNKLFADVELKLYGLYA